MEIDVWVCIVIFGIDFSSQKKSSRVEVRFWLAVKLEWGFER